MSAFLTHQANRPRRHGAISLPVLPPPVRAFAERSPSYAVTVYSQSERIKTELQGLEVPPSASADVDLDTPSRFSITFSPAPHLVITKRTTFDIRVPMSYPSTPPLVNCLDTKLGALVKGGEETVDDTGKVKLALLTFDGSWNHNYTLSHVTWALHEMMKRPDVPTVRVIPCSSPTSQRFTAQEAGHYGRRGHRPTMEDETCAFPKLSVGDGRVRPLAFYAVFDGHGGRRAAEYASKHLHKTLLAAITDGMTVPYVAASLAALPRHCYSCGALTPTWLYAYLCCLFQKRAPQGVCGHRRRVHCVAARRRARPVGDHGLYRCH